jgi:hypothetical protein
MARETITAEMVAPVIDGLSAVLLPHRQWVLRKWFYASPLWFYHRAGTLEELNTNRTFYRLVDEDLRELCRILNEAGLHTTPSCQGHVYGREHFRNVWDELRNEEPLIQRPGLLVKDSETDQPYLFREPGYHLPWPDFENFHAEAAAHQSQGYLGVLITSERDQLRSLLQRDRYSTERSSICFDAELSTKLNVALFNMMVEAREPVERRREWAALTAYIANLLNRVDR